MESVHFITNFISNHTLGISLCALAAISSYIFFKTSNLKRTPVSVEKDSPQEYVKNRNDKIFKQLDPHNMRHHWYPVEFSKEVTHEKQKGFTLLNEPLVLYRAEDGTIQCAQDKCPHRSAKLSLGKMINGSLECLYHGWLLFSLKIGGLLGQLK